MVSVLQRCLSYRDSNKGSKERQGPTVVSVLQRCPSYRDSNKGSAQFTGVHLIEVSIKRESTVHTCTCIK